MKTDLFVYYRAHTADAGAIEDHVRRLQAGLGVPASLYRRPDLKDGLQTWMEVYRAIPAEFEARLAAAAADCGILEHIVGARHCEFFLEIAPCA